MREQGGQQEAKGERIVIFHNAFFINLLQVLRVAAGPFRVGYLNELSVVHEGDFDVAE